MTIRLTEKQATSLFRMLAKKRGSVKCAPHKKVCSINGDSPQEILWRMIVRHFGYDLVEWEYKGAVPGRRFRIDIAFPKYKLTIECDGYEHHGKYPSGFRNDRQRQNLLAVNGWKVLRFYTRQILREPDYVIHTITACISSIDPN